MFDPRYPWLAIAALALTSTGALVYYGALVSGIYKDPLMAHFRAYGLERPYRPICRFLDTLALWSLLLSSLLDSITAIHRTSTNLYAPVIFLALSFMAFGFSLLARRYPVIGMALPPWYNDLLRNSSRQERRQIAFAWLRIPRLMRWRLNADQASFHVWVELVRLTVFYGARDPDDPWAIWN